VLRLCEKRGRPIKDAPFFTFCGRCCKQKAITAHTISAAAITACPAPNTTPDTNVIPSSTFT